MMVHEDGRDPLELPEFDLASNDRFVEFMAWEAVQSLDWRFGKSREMLMAYEAGMIEVVRLSIAGTLGHLYRLAELRDRESYSVGARDTIETFADMYGLDIAMVEVAEDELGG